jgi:DNA-binding response OmpR family regulator
VTACGKREFVSTVSHELRTPLSAIRVMAETHVCACQGTQCCCGCSSGFGRFQVDLVSRRLQDAGGQPVELTRTEFDLLVFLLRNAGKALTRDQILTSVWGEDTVVDAHTVDNFVSNLRRKLEWTSDSGFELRSVRGVGYRMELAR